MAVCTVCVCMVCARTEQHERHEYDGSERAGLVIVRHRGAHAQTQTDDGRREQLGESDVSEEVAGTGAEAHHVVGHRGADQGKQNWDTSQRALSVRA